MNMRRLVRYGLAVVLGAAALVEFTTHIGRGWWRGEAFYQYRPSSYWRAELRQWRHIPFA